MSRKLDGKGKKTQIQVNVSAKAFFNGQTDEDIVDYLNHMIINGTNAAW